MKLRSEVEALTALRSRVTSQHLSLGEDVGALSAELARRAAAVLCPCAPMYLVSSVTSMLQQWHLLDERDTAREIIEGLVASGDLLVQNELVHLAPLTYVRHGTGRLFLQGGLPDTSTVIAPGLASMLEFEGPYRVLRTEKGVTDEVVESLRSDGYEELPEEQWLAAPPARSSGDLLSSLSVLLNAARRSGRVEGLRILDASRDARRYITRWRTPRENDHGRYVARRERPHRGELACYAEISAGQPLRMIDLPVTDLRFAPFDEAWWIQCAIDADLGRPQQLLLERRDGQTLIGVNTPLPRWAERHLCLIGRRVERGLGISGAYSSFAVDDQDVDQEVVFFQERLWMKPELHS